jgi:hypothetical protein
MGNSKFEIRNSKDLAREALSVWIPGVSRFRPRGSDLNSFEFRI